MRPATLFLIFGVLLVLAGLVALLNPFAASIAVTTLVGIFFLIGGVLQLWLAFSDASRDDRLWNGVVGAMGVVAGVFLLANPLEGMVRLTLILGVLFLITGAARLIVAFRLRQTPLFWMLLLSGAASLLIGVVVFTNFAAAAATLLGLLLAFQLIAEGAALVALGLLARKL